MLRALVACECSGRVREALRRIGFDAWSCDLKPAEDGSPFHITGDVLPLLDEEWDLLVAHPTCTRLANSGGKHLYKGMRKENGIDPEKWQDMLDGATFYLKFRESRARYKVIENPIWHAHASAVLGRPQRQFVQPWWFGDEAFKATGFELHNLPNLVPTDKLTPPKPGTEEHKRWSAVHREPPGPQRRANRSRTFPGIAEAIAQQLGMFVLSEEISLATDTTPRYTSFHPLIQTEQRAVNIELKITGETAGDVLRELGILTAAFYTKLNSTAPAPAPAPVAQSLGEQMLAAELAAAAPRRGRKKKKESENDVLVPGAGTDSGVDGVGVAGGTGSAEDAAVGGRGSDAASAGSVGETAASGSSDGAEATAGDAQVDADAVQEPAPAAKPLTYDELRAFVIDQYINKFWTKREEQTEAFRGLLAQFDIPTLKGLPEERLPEFKALVDRKIADKIAA